MPSEVTFGRHMQRLDDERLLLPFASSKAARFTTLARQGSPGAFQWYIAPVGHSTTTCLDPSSGSYVREGTDDGPRPNNETIKCEKRDGIKLREHNTVRMKHALKV
jgi:hypothetical protein